MLKSVTRSADGDVALLPTFRTGTGKKTPPGKSFRGAATPCIPYQRYVSAGTPL